MALTAAALLALRSDPDFQVRLQVAIAAVARGILLEESSKTFNPERIRWAREANRVPSSKVEEVAWATLTDPTIRGVDDVEKSVTDSMLEDAVKAVVDGLVRPERVPT